MRRYTFIIPLAICLFIPACKKEEVQCTDPGFFAGSWEVQSVVKDLNINGVPDAAERVAWPSWMAKPKIHLQGNVGTIERPNKAGTALGGHPITWSLENCARDMYVQETWERKYYIHIYSISSKELIIYTIGEINPTPAYDWFIYKRVK